MTDNEFNELEPSEALEMYVAVREPEVRESTIRSIRSRVGLFVEWCEREGIQQLYELDGMDLHRYRLKTARDVAKLTLISRLSSVRMFLRWARSVDAVEPELPERIEIPDGERARTRYLESGAAEDILRFLEKYRYASRDHAMMLLTWETGARIGAIRSLDVRDYDAEEPCVSFKHRPETDTPIKNGRNGERVVGLAGGTREVIDAYLSHNRVDVRDDHGRDPLLTTAHGRPSNTTMQRTIYRLTRPCIYDGGCPHDKDPDECPAANDSDIASKCPSSVSAHDVRRGYLTYLSREEVPKAVISDRCDVSPDVLEKHYNQMTDREKMDARRDYLDGL
ncbi:tyrosine-type recombinase/integrase [Natronomonas marina]|uniref:tyrosine-type recombinase/integrase n=1 Tax=Natronomonas marina TaxID=2961939 RepID=UPI0020C9A588|nr:tyrosine-type recombinase/integrase [Natronomonas marina]